MLSFNEKLEFELLPYIQGNDKPGVEFLTEKNSIAAFEEKMSNLNKIISDDAELVKNHVCYMNSTAKGYLFSLEPYYNRIASALYRRGLLPSTIIKKRKYHLLNYLLCESHLERLINALYNIKD